MKQKTHQALAKRLKLTKSRRAKKHKMIHIACGRDHFNARESGNTTRAKRRGRILSGAFSKSVKVLIPGTK